MRVVGDQRKAKAYQYHTSSLEDGEEASTLTFVHARVPIE